MLPSVGKSKAGKKAPCECLGRLREQGQRSLALETLKLNLGPKLSFWGEISVPSPTPTPGHTHTQGRPLSGNWQTFLFISPATGLVLAWAFGLPRACAQCLEKLALGTAI